MAAPPSTYFRARATLGVSTITFNACSTITLLTFKPAPFPPLGLQVLFTIPKLPVLI